MTNSAFNQIQAIFRTEKPVGLPESALIAMISVTMSVDPQLSGMLRHLFRTGIAALLVSVVSAAPGNFYRVDDKVWRSAQPDTADFADLRKLGIKDVLNLREWHDDSSVSRSVGVNLHRVAINPGNVREKDLIQAVKILRDARGSILVHCWHGSDRTGTVVALYRMSVDGWPRDKAVAEFADPRYGYHAGTYPELRRYLEKVDIAAFTAALD
jgi:tyrosine-protein phosphatase SIW14